MSTRARVESGILRDGIMGYHEKNRAIYIHAMLPRKH